MYLAQNHAGIHQPVFWCITNIHTYKYICMSSPGGLQGPWLFLARVCAWEQYTRIPGWTWRSSRQRMMRILHTQAAKFKRTRIRTMLCMHVIAEWWCKLYSGGKFIQNSMSGQKIYVNINIRSTPWHVCTCRLIKCESIFWVRTLQVSTWSCVQLLMFLTFGK